MLKLLTFGGNGNIPSLSPFCVKAMCLLKMSGKDWEPKYLSDPSKMPYGKLPVLDVDGRLIADSSHIQVYLEQHGAEFNAGLTEAQKAVSHALITMVEQNLMSGLAYERWIRPENWAVMSDIIFSDVPKLMRPLIAGTVRRRVRNALEAHGIAKFVEEERDARLLRDLQAVSVTLGDKPYLLGKEPTAADAAITPVLDMIRTIPTEGILRRAVKDNATLDAYVDRVRQAIYPSL